MDNTDEILLFVPRQYTVDLTETTNDQSCAFSTVDYSNNANEFSENVIAVNGSCPSSRNQITL